MAMQSLQDLIPAVTPQLLQDITDKIVAKFHPEKIILFGSYAWGHPRWDSDVDLFVVMESDLRWAQRSVAVSVACRPDFLPMDVIVKTPAELRQRLEQGDSFLSEILTRGKILYER